MTLTIELTPTEEARLLAAAQKEGVEPAELARKLLASHLPAADETSDPTLALLAEWEKTGRTAEAVPLRYIKSQGFGH